MWNAVNCISLQLQLRDTSLGHLSNHLISSNLSFLIWKRRWLNYVIFKVFSSLKNKHDSLKKKLHPNKWGEILVLWYCAVRFWWYRWTCLLVQITESLTLTDPVSWCLWPMKRMGMQLHSPVPTVVRQMERSCPEGRVTLDLWQQSVPVTQWRSEWQQLAMNEDLKLVLYLDFWKGWDVVLVLLVFSPRNSHFSYLNNNSKIRVINEICKNLCP